uniref:Ribonuclease H protein At1g65750 family n=1 Tax=Cajanus cajan TaxID=3821 RepID=A0A151SR66_CAJCA|nr:Putative ribonuclease H protein At1g65750 family [Cajanus cajan]
MYKILSKVLANRLKSVLPSIIDERQSAFIGEEFGPKKGLRQGDPLSPFLFIVVAEGLTGMMREAVSQNSFGGVKVGSQQVPVSIIQYADDTMFIGEANLQNVMTIKSMMRCFEMVSGLKVNFCKSNFGALGIESGLVESYAHLLNCKILSFPFTYLGIPIGANPRKKDTWRPIVIKIQKKLSSWKCKVLSMAGRVCLLNSVLTSLPLLFLSFFRIPPSVSKEIVSLQRNFLWGCKEDQRKICWISWDRVTLPKKMGGLGVKNIIRFNMALLAKWRWSLFHQNDSLWARVLYSRYGGGTNLCAQSSSRRDSLWWRDLVVVCGGLEQDNWFDRKVKWSIGSGSRVRFWLDKWIGPICLASLFPRLFTISEQQNQFIQDMGYWTGHRWAWQLHWRRERFEWEIPLEQQLMQRLLECNPRARQVDSWWWLGEPSGTYTVRSAYSAITSELSCIVHHHRHSIPMKHICCYHLVKLKFCNLQIISLDLT